MSRDRRNRTRKTAEAAIPEPDPPAPEEGITPAPPLNPARRRAWLPLLAIGLLLFVFFAPFIFQGKVFLAADTLSEFYPWKSYAPPGFAAHNKLITDPVNLIYSFSQIFNDQLKQGKFASWSPYILGGIPTFFGRSYPPGLFFHTLFPTATALTLSLMTHLLLMGLFMYLYLKEIGAGSRGAVFGAAVFMFNGCAMVWLSFETVIPNAAYLPLLLFIMERFQTPRRFFFAFLGALALGLLFVAGHLQYILYTGMIMLFYCAFLLVRAILRKAPPSEMAAIVACAAITAAGGVLLGALELMPNWEVINYSSRVNRSFDFEGLFTTLGRVPYRWLITLVFPDYFGSPIARFNVFPSAGGEYMNYNELCLYLGIPTLFALLALAIRPRTAHGRFYLGLTVLTMMMLAGSFLFYPFFKFFPGMDRLNPTRMIFIFVFATAVAAGLGIRNLEDIAGKLRLVFLGSALALTVTVALLALTGSADGAITFFNGEQFGATNATPPWIFEKLRSMRSLASPIIMKPLVLTLLSGALFSLWVWFGKKRWAALFPVLLISLLGYDLISFGWNYNTLVTPNMIYPTTPSIAFLQRQPGPFRVVVDAGRGFNVNVLQPYGIQEIGGYTSVYPERVNKLMSAIEYGPNALLGALFDRWVMFRNVQNPLFDLLNVRYVLTAPNVRLPDNPRYRLVSTGDMTIYENLQALPRAFAVHRPVLLRDTAEIITYMTSQKFDPRREVVLEEEQPAAFVAAAAAGASSPSRAEIRNYFHETVEIAAEMSAPGWLVLSDSFFPGWEVEVDGKLARILRADCSLRAVAVPSGTHRVVFTYRPQSIARGRMISAFALLIITAGIMLSWTGTKFPRIS